MLQLFLAGLFLAKLKKTLRLYMFVVYIISFHPVPEKNIVINFSFLNRYYSIYLWIAWPDFTFWNPVYFSLHILTLCLEGSRVSGHLCILLELLQKSFKWSPCVFLQHLISKLCYILLTELFPLHFTDKDV